MIYEPIQVFEGDGISIDDKEKEIHLAELRKSHEEFKKIFSDLKQRKTIVDWSEEAKQDLQDSIYMDIEELLIDAIRTNPSF